jgi:CTP:molybdopterin cytidylyltransferase MocA
MPGSRDCVIVIPACNEQETIAGVVRTARSLACVSEVIVVNNRSADLTRERALAAGASVVECDQIGKAQAVRTGIDTISSTPDTIIFLDADLRGLTAAHLELMITELSRNDMVCGVLTKLSPKAHFLRTSVGKRISTLTGQRAVRFSVLEKLELDCRGYWLETYLNQTIPRARRTNVPILGVSHTRREQKVSGLSKLMGIGTRIAVAATYDLLLWADGLYAAIKERIQIPKRVTGAWRANRTSRPAQVLETIKLACDIPGDEQPLAHTIRTIFQFRDWSVHPPAEFRGPVVRDDLQFGAPWQYVAFSASNAKQLILAGLNIATLCVWHPKLMTPTRRRRLKCLSLGIHNYSRRRHRTNRTAANSLKGTTS